MLTRLRQLAPYLWPRSLFGRLSLILLFGLCVAHVLSFGMIVYEREQASKASMIYYLGHDVAGSIAMLERLPAIERAAWLTKLDRNNYRYFLRPAGPASVHLPEKSADRALAHEVIHSVSVALGKEYTVTPSFYLDAEARRHMDLHLQLSDGTPVSIEMVARGMTYSVWLPVILMSQLLILIAFSWLAVRLATRPLAQLAAAADNLSPDKPGDLFPTDGPLEVAKAGIAFNAMQQRISAYLSERIQILAAVTHDLQTPITRMRLRVDMLDDEAHRDKLLRDLLAMQSLVEQGIAYARAHNRSQRQDEKICSINLDALLRSLVSDYQDAGHSIAVTGQLGRPIRSAPLALKRILSNLLDNALKFGTQVEIGLQGLAADQISITVMDRGPGIPVAELNAVLQPYYRVENSRNRDTGGSGLGLAIAQQLSLTLGGSLHLSNRDGGGLLAELRLPNRDA
ncbi:MAG: ATP-binding protein [Burkholderiales bacterium]|nr:ATP-binding protein [Burkholderiales bacterium]